MKQPVCPPASPAALAARRILRALESGDVARLEGELQQAAESPQACPDMPPDRLERLELLKAVAEAMRGALSRMRRGLADRLEDAGAQLRLLRHLAADLG